MLGFEVKDKSTYTNFFGSFMLVFMLFVYQDYVDGIFVCSRWTSSSSVLLCLQGAENSPVNSVESALARVGDHKLMWSDGVIRIRAERVFSRICSIQAKSVFIPIYAKFLAYPSNTCCCCVYYSLKRQ